MSKKEIKIIAILAAVAILGLAVLFVINNYRGDDGLTYSERKHLEKNGEAVIDWEAMEEAQDEEGFFARLFNGRDKSKNADSDTANSTSGNDKDGSVKNDSNKNNNSSSSNNNSGKDNETSKGEQDSGTGSTGGGKDDVILNPDDGVDYAEYMAMSPEQQEAYFKTFDSPEAFIKWLNNAKAKYDNSDNSIKVEGGGIDIGDYQ